MTQGPSTAGWSRCKTYHLVLHGSFMPWVKIGAVVSPSGLAGSAGTARQSSMGVQIGAKLPSYFIDLVKYFDWFERKDVKHGYFPMKWVMERHNFSKKKKP